MKRVFFFNLLLAGAIAGKTAEPRLQYVVIVSRHGVRSPSWDAARLNQYSVEPWPDWNVAPGELTPHGRSLIKLMGTYYREWLSNEHLLSAKGCDSAGRISIWADTDERTLETGRAFAQSLAPGCEIPIHSQAGDQKDPLFSGYGKPDAELASRALSGRLGPDPQKLLAHHKSAFDTLQFVLTGGGTAPKMLEAPWEIGVAASGKGAELTGPFSAASTLSEDFLLEYTNGFSGSNLGWGRLTRENLREVLELHTLYADLTRRTLYLAQAHGSNLLFHILCSLEQAVSGKTTPGALGRLGDSLLVLAGHDTNLSNLSGMLGLSWKIAGYQPDDTPPGGALIFSLWRESTSVYFVKLRYVTQTLDQMRDGLPLSLATPPASQDVSLARCEGCPWEAARGLMKKAIASEFTSLER